MPMDKDIESVVGQANLATRQIRNAVRDGWQQLAGAHLSKMLTSGVIAEEYLSHTDPGLRRVALSVLDRVWKHSERSALLCQVLALNDPDQAVRACAVSSLGLHYSRTDNEKVSRLLAGIVRDELLDIELRRFAYYALFEVRSVPGTRDPRLLGDFSFPGDVDWRFVDRFLTTK